MEKTSAQMSVKRSVTVRGYEVRRLPLGEYLRALEAVRMMPETVMQACFPDMDAMQLLAYLKTIDKNALTALILKMAMVVPAEAIRLLSVLTGIDEETLMTDGDIGLDGAAEMLEAFWQLNGIENFISAARRMAAQIRNVRNGGSKG